MDRTLLLLLLRGGRLLVRGSLLGWAGIETTEMMKRDLAGVFSCGLHMGTNTCGLGIIPLN